MVCHNHILVDDEVKTYFDDKKKETNETPNDILRRILKIKLRRKNK